MRRKKSINVVLAEALKHYMGDHWTPYALAKKSGAVAASSAAISTSCTQRDLDLPPTSDQQ